MSVKIIGQRDFKNKMKMLGDAFGDAVDGGAFVTANEIRTDAIKSIQAVSPGRQVQRVSQGGGDTYTHTAAAEGSAPNTDTGKLVSSVAAEKIGSGVYHIGSKLDYAEWLEFGTSKMGARPWLDPAFRAKAQHLIINITDVVDRQIKRLVK